MFYQIMVQFGDVEPFIRCSEENSTSNNFNHQLESSLKISLQPPYVAKAADFS